MILDFAYTTWRAYIPHRGSKEREAPFFGQGKVLVEETGTTEAPVAAVIENLDFRGEVSSRHEYRLHNRKLWRSVEEDLRSVLRVPGPPPSDARPLSDLPKLGREVPRHEHHREDRAVYEAAGRTLIIDGQPFVDMGEPFWTVAFVGGNLVEAQIAHHKPGASTFLQSARLDDTNRRDAYPPAHHRPDHPRRPRCATDRRQADHRAHLDPKAFPLTTDILSLVFQSAVAARVITD